jgi:hypothetical protein
MIKDMSKKYCTKIYSTWDLEDITEYLCKTTWDNHYVAYKYRVQIFIKILTLVTQFLQIQVPDMFTLPLTKTLLK